MVHGALPGGTGGAGPTGNADRRHSQGRI